MSIFIPTGYLRKRRAWWSEIKGDVDECVTYSEACANAFQPHVEAEQESLDNARATIDMVRACGMHAVQPTTQIV